VVQTIRPCVAYMPVPCLGELETCRSACYPSVSAERLLALGDAGRAREPVAGVAVISAAAPRGAYAGAPRRESGVHEWRLCLSPLHKYNSPPSRLLR